MVQQRSEQEVEQEVREMMKTIHEHGGNGKAVSVSSEMGGYEVAAILEEIINAYVSQKMGKEELWETMEVLKLLRTLETTCSLLQDAVTIAYKDHLKTAKYEKEEKEEDKDGTVEP